MEPENLPNKKPPVTVTNLDEYAIFKRDSLGRLLLHHESGNRRNGLWKLPLRSREACLGLNEIYTATYAITRYRVSLQVFLSEAEQVIPLLPGDEWIDPDRLAKLPIAAPFRKALDLIIRDF